MSKKDFELIASIIKESYGGKLQGRVLAFTFAEKLSEKYPKFNKERFLKACGVKITNCLDCGITLRHDEELEDCRCMQCEAIFSKTIINN